MKSKIHAFVLKFHGFALEIHLYSKYIKLTEVNTMIKLTPPMGWNSWNTFGENINEK